VLACGTHVSVIGQSSRSIVAQTVSHTVALLFEQQ
jgi:hypothetical protein